MWIRCSDGRLLPGILLALIGDHMRVALPEMDDVAEYRLINGRWISEDCEPVTFEFPLAVFQAAGIMPEGQEAEPVPCRLRIGLRAGISEAGLEQPI